MHTPTTQPTITLKRLADGEALGTFDYVSEAINFIEALLETDVIQDVDDVLWITDQL